MGKFVPTKEWLEAAKQKPVSYGSIKFMCQLATEHMPKNDARFKYWNQLRGTILSMAKGTNANILASLALSANAWHMIGLRKIKFSSQVNASCQKPFSKNINVIKKRIAKIS